MNMKRIPNKVMNRTRPLKRRIQKEVKELRGQLFLDLNRETKNSIILVGMGRSGTTWISNIINYNNEFRYMFEPFHPLLVKANNGFKLFQYLRPSNDEPYFLDTAKSILTGQLRNKRVDSYNRKLFYKKRLIKDISAPLFLKWINVNFPDVPIILLLRHPCAVAISKLKLLKYKKGWDGVETPEHFLSQKDLVNDFLHPFVEDIRAAKNPFEHQILAWCIIHYTVLKQFEANQVHLAFYENFCRHPEDEIRRLFLHIQKDPDEAIADKRVSQKLKEPSQRVQKSSAILSGGNLVDEWRRHITDSQMNRAVQMLREFQLDTIYSYESMPNVVGAYELLGKHC